MIRNIGKQLLNSRLGKRASGVAKAAGEYGETTAEAYAKKSRDHLTSMSTSKGGKFAGRTIGNTKVQAGLIAGVGIQGFMSGMDQDNQTSSAVMDLAFGDPDYDKHVMGRKMGVRELMMPMPGERYARNSPIGVAAKVGPGGIAGSAVGAGVGGLGALALRGGVKGGLIGAAAGLAIGGYAGNRALPGRAPAGAVVTKRTFQDAWKDNRRSSRSTPYVDGSIAFGMYNSRLG